MLEILWQSFLATLIVVIVAGVFYAFYYVLKFMFDNVIKSDD